MGRMDLATVSVMGHLVRSWALAVELVGLKVPTSSRTDWRKGRATIPG